MPTKWWSLTIIFRILFLYFIFISNAFAIPKAISLCVWKADMASVLQYGRQHEEVKDILYNRNKVERLLTIDKRPRWFTLQVLRVFDYVWKEYPIEKSPSYVFKTTYNECIRNYKNPIDIYY